MSLRLAALLLLCGGLAWQVTEGQAPRPLPPAPRPAMPAAAPVAPLPPPAAAPWGEQVARPLFASTRRPPQPPVEVVPEAPSSPEPPPPVAASGVVRRGDSAVALLRLADERTVRAALGEEVEGWQVTRIHAGGVEVTRGGQTVSLSARFPAAGGLVMD